MTYFELALLVDVGIVALLGWFLTARVISMFEAVLASILVALTPYYLWLASQSAFLGAYPPGNNWFYIVAMALPFLCLVAALLFGFGKSRKFFVRAVRTLVTIAFVVVAWQIPHQLFADVLGEKLPPKLAIDQALSPTEMDHLPLAFHDHQRFLEVRGNQRFGLGNFGTYVAFSKPLRAYQSFCWTLTAIDKYRGYDIDFRGSYLFDRHARNPRLYPLASTVFGAPAQGIRIEVPMKTEPGQRVYFVLRIHEPVEKERVPSIFSRRAEVGECAGG